MKFICAECKKENPHFKGLLDHYKDKHPGLLKRFQIRHIPSTITGLIYSPNIETALKFHQWDQKDCKIKEVK